MLASTTGTPTCRSPPAGLRRPDRRAGVRGLVGRRLPDHVGQQRPAHPHPGRPLDDRGPLPRPEGRSSWPRTTPRTSSSPTSGCRRRPGTDAALGMAMGHVVLKEFFVDRQVDVLRGLRPDASPTCRYLVALEEGADGRTIARASSSSRPTSTARRRRPRTRCSSRCCGRGDRQPRRARTARWATGSATRASARWNLDLGEVDPALSCGPRATRSTVELPRFDTRRRRAASLMRARRAGAPHRRVPGHHGLRPDAGPVRRRRATACRGAGRPATTTPTPPTRRPGRRRSPVSRRDQVARIAREFARTPRSPKGRSMILMGAGTNHWFHSDTIYRTFLTLTTLTGCQGATAAAGRTTSDRRRAGRSPAGRQSRSRSDWTRPPRQMIQTGYWYLHTDQFRYDHVRARTPWPRRPVSGRVRRAGPRPTCRRSRARMGWMPSYPTFDRNPIDLGRRGRAAAGSTGGGAMSSTQLKNGGLRFAGEDPDDPENCPRVLSIWRANLLGSSAKGNEYFLKHLLGTDSCRARRPRRRRSTRPRDVVWREEAPAGQARSAADPRLPDDEHDDLLRRRAAGGDLVREARPQHDRYAPVRALVQPGDRTALADPDRLGRLRGASPRNSAELAATAPRRPQGRRRRRR